MGFILDSSYNGNYEVTTTSFDRKSTRKAQYSTLPLNDIKYLKHLIRPLNDINSTLPLNDKKID